ncbi:uncharacterized protein LOC132198260 [Neocloeon triangulifer]|uniref:uncharacterized protein LOC132198260 n=1 Tax=Neocloeon triangulifer TaxID=2078957 RepID=UPI00286EC597|nr:uncharacterized protein LOC132198260 [Neocloeon triangulifer]
MGCALCKDSLMRRASGITAYDYAKNVMTPGSRSRQASVISQPTRRSKTSLDSSDREPPIYFLSGSPALHYAPPPPEFRQQFQPPPHPLVPPPKTPRTSGWKSSSLSVPEVPSRPPRRANKRAKRSVSSEKIISSNTLAAPEPVHGLSRSSSSPSIPVDIDLPEETAQRLEMYLKKNQSFSSIHILLNELQAQNNIDLAGLNAYESDEDDEHWNPTCLDLAGIQLPTSRRHSIEKSPEEGEENPSDLKRSSSKIFITSCDDADVEVEAPLGGNKGAFLSPPNSRNQAERGATRLQLCDLRKFSDVTEGDEEIAAMPKTPGSWFDRDGTNMEGPPNFLSRTKTLSLQTEDTLDLREETMVTPPPSEEDLSDEEPISSSITHSILHKVLRGLSSDETAETLISRRGSAGNVSLSGLEEFLKALQQQLTDSEEKSHEAEPTIGDLQAALSELLNAEKINEKQQLHDIQVP